MEIKETMMKNTNGLPELTDDERRRNLERAMEARRARAELKQYVKAGKLSLAEALDDSRASRLTVRQLLMSVPGIGAKKAGRIMLACGIAPSRRVNGLGPRQREALLSMQENGWKEDTRR